MVQGAFLLLLLCAFPSWALAPSLARARDYYVSPAGEDSNPGTLTEPWRSIAKVNDTRLQPGDCVHFQGGRTFTGTVELGRDDSVKNNRRSGIDIYSASPNASDCQVYNNTIYNRHGSAVGFGGLPMPNVVFRNNIFLCCHDVLSGEAPRGRFEGNLYWSADGRGLSFDGRHSIREWAEATGQEKIGDKIVGRVIDPLLTGPGTAAITDPAALASLVAYKLTPDSPCLGVGLVIKDNGGRDFWGNRVPNSERPALGACEKPGS